MTSFEYAELVNRMNVMDKKLEKIEKLLGCIYWKLTKGDTMKNKPKKARESSLFDTIEMPF